MNQFEEYIQVPSERRTLKALVEKAKDFALIHAACMRKKGAYDEDSLQFAPFTLLPSPFPKREFQIALELQPTLNLLINSVAHDYEFLKRVLASTIAVDPFIATLFQIYEEVLQHGAPQIYSLGLLRSDMMLESSCEKKKLFGGTVADHKSSEEESVAQEKFKCVYCCFKQVEINTIAAGFGHMGPASRAIHQYVLRELGEERQIDKLPENRALEEMSLAIIKAWELYDHQQAVILFIIEDMPFNICDQRFHEFKIQELRPEIRVIRKTLTQISRESRIANGRLEVKGGVVGVVYFRAGYEPQHYPTKAEWEARLIIELSNAIKCPSINYHLAGM